MVGHPVAGQEFAQPARVGRVARADDPHAAADLDQQRPAGQVRPEDQVAELLVTGDQLAQALERHVDHLARVADDRAQVHPATGQQVELAKEPMRAMDRDHMVLGAVTANDRHRPGLDHEEVVAVVPFLEQQLA